MVKYYPVVRFHITEDGDPETDKSWHLIVEKSAGYVAMCTAQHFGFGESSIDNQDGLDYEERVGPVTCENCRNEIKFIKGVKL